MLKERAHVMAHLKLTSLMDSRNQILCCPDTELKDIFMEGLRLLDADSNICKLVQADLDECALRMKRERLAETAELESCLPTLPEMAPASAGEIRATDVNHFSLGTGRPRSLDAEAVFLMSMVRAHLDSVTSKTARDRLHDSELVNAYFEGRGMSRPSESVIHFWVNQIRRPTHDYILDAQLEMVFAEGLDDMKSVTADSFSVWADTAWPTDSAMIHGLLRRAWHVASNLPKFGLSTFTPGWVGVWLDRLRDFDRRISFACGKANSKRKIRRLYQKLFARAELLLARMDRQLEKLLPAWSAELDTFSGALRSRLERKLDSVFNDLADAARVLAYARERVFDGKSTPMSEKILSLSDGSAAYIRKGQREPVIGYKPQVVRSRNGFVTAFELQQGNPADAARLVPMTLQHVARTGLIPETVSVDDGYSSRANRKALLDMGVGVVSMNGATGRKVTPEEEWASPLYERARDDRSAVESLVFTLRRKFHLHRFSRRGLDNVVTEMYEKVIAHNLWRAALLRKRAAAQKPVVFPAAA